MARYHIYVIIASSALKHSRTLGSMRLAMARSYIVVMSVRGVLMDRQGFSTINGGAITRRYTDSFSKT